MQKFFCDICGVELAKETEIGSFTRIVKKFGFYKKKFVNTEFVKENFDLCEKCQKRIFEFVERLKKEIQKQ